MNSIKNFWKDIAGFSAISQEPWSISPLTLSFTGNLIKYEEEFRDDYFLKSLNPFRLSLILGMIFYSAFAFLDTVTVPGLKEIFWFIRFAIVFPVLIGVFLFTYFEAFKKFMQFVISGIMFLTGFGIIVMIIFQRGLGIILIMQDLS
jgi:hypothetical protein